MNDPLVSVIIPTYRRPEMLRAALETAKAQTFTDFEVIVSDDDAESGEVARIVEELDDPRVRHLSHEPLGLPGNFLAGERVARGRFVASLNDDDLWKPGLLERLVPLLLGDDTLTVAFTDLDIARADGTVDPEATGLHNRRWGREGLAEGAHRPFQHLALLRRTVPITISSVVRREAIEWHDFPSEVGPVWDLWLAYLACRDGGGAYFVPERLVRYRTGHGSISGLNRLDFELCYCYSRFLLDPRLDSLRPSLRRASAPFWVGSGLELMRQGQRREGRHNVAVGFVRSPSLRGAAALAASVLPVGPAGLARLGRLQRQLA